MMTFLSTAPLGQSTSSMWPSSSTSFGRIIFILSARSARSGHLRSLTWATSSLPREWPWTPTRWRPSPPGRSRSLRGLFAGSLASRGTTGSSSGNLASSRPRSRVSSVATPSLGMWRPLQHSRPSRGPSRRDPYYRCRISTFPSPSTATPPVQGLVQFFIRSMGPSPSSADPLPPPS